MFARVEIGVTKFSPKNRRRQNFGSETAVFSGEFSFFGRGKTNFWGGGITSQVNKWLASEQ